MNIFVDLSKCFDTLDHKILLDKFKNNKLLHLQNLPSEPNMEANMHHIHNIAYTNPRLTMFMQNIVYTLICLVL